MGGLPLEEDQLTPSKLKQYVAMHLESLIQNEEARSNLHEELVEAKATAMMYERSLGDAHAAAEDQATLVELLKEQVAAQQQLEQSMGEELTQARADVDAAKERSDALTKELQDLHEHAWEDQV